MAVTHSRPGRDGGAIMRDRQWHWVHDRIPQRGRAVDWAPPDDATRVVSQGVGATASGGLLRASLQENGSVGKARDSVLRGACTRLYRAVSDAELEDILHTGFRAGDSTMETKLFVVSPEDASFFARNILFPLDRKPLTIVEIEIPESLASRLFRFITDGKTTIAVDPSLLKELNAVAAIQPLPGALLPHP